MPGSFLHGENSYHLKNMNGGEQKERYLSGLSAHAHAHAHAVLCGPGTHPNKHSREHSASMVLDTDPIRRIAYYSIVPIDCNVNARVRFACNDVSFCNSVITGG